VVEGKKEARKPMDKVSDGRAALKLENPGSACTKAITKNEGTFLLGGHFGVASTPMYRCSLSLSRSVWLFNGAQRLGAHAECHERRFISYRTAIAPTCKSRE
jgi:hypothetical protein